MDYLADSSVVHNFLIEKVELDSHNSPSTKLVCTLQLEVFFISAKRFGNRERYYVPLPASSVDLWVYYDVWEYLGSNLFNTLRIDSIAYHSFYEKLLDNSFGQLIYRDEINGIKFSLLAYVSADASSIPPKLGAAVPLQKQQNKNVIVLISVISFFLLLVGGGFLYFWFRKK